MKVFLCELTPTVTKCIHATTCLFLIMNALCTETNIINPQLTGCMELTVETMIAVWTHTLERVNVIFTCSSILTQYRLTLIYKYTISQSLHNMAAKSTRPVSQIVKDTPCPALNIILFELSPLKYFGLGLFSFIHIFNCIKFHSYQFNH